MDRPGAEELELLHQELCSALSDTTRIAILYEVAGGARCVGEIVSALGLPQGTISRHLRILRERGLLRAEREANRVYYRLTEPRAMQILELMRAILRDSLRRWQEAAVRIEGGRRPARKRKGDER